MKPILRGKELLFDLVFIIVPILFIFIRSVGVSDIFIFIINLYMFTIFTVILVNVLCYMIGLLMSTKQISIFRLLYTVLIMLPLCIILDDLLYEYLIKYLNSGFLLIAYHITLFCVSCFSMYLVEYVKFYKGKRVIKIKKLLGYCICAIFMWILLLIPFYIFEKFESFLSEMQM
ncbi:TPA: hypothetical protein JY259_004627 [Salmonella enterica subsp. enterica serovar Infantis]|nr:hypothetical protein [Salmonella enterica subsp. enterica serovar Infantis]